MEKKKFPMGLSTVRKKVLILSKLVGVGIVLFYLATSKLSNKSVAFWIWFIFVVAVILGVDFLLGRMISTPLQEINGIAGKMAKLDFSAHCDVHTGDEFENLSDHLNRMFENLQETLQHLEEANKQLEKDVEKEKQLLAQRKELVDSLSHEMKTPLGLIRAYTEGLKDETDQKKKEQYMEAILSATKRMDHMIVSLLDLSALEAGSVKLSEERFDFIELVETVAGRLLLDTPGTDYEFTYELPEKKLFVCADRQRLEQVLNNLIENAKKYVVPYGKIHLEVENQRESLRFSIYNQGEAISDEEIPKIWQKFYRTRNTNRKGSGLGLAIVSQILSLYQVPYGVVKRDQGIEFYFQFPTVP